MYKSKIIIFATILFFIPILVNSVVGAEATGFYRVEQINGIWWFVKPDGGLMYSIGLTDVPGYNLIYEAKGTSSYQTAWDAAENTTPSASDWATYIKSWGFTNAAAWGGNCNDRLPSTPCLIWMLTAQNGWFGPDIPANSQYQNYPDVTSTEFAEFCDLWAQRLVAPMADDPSIIGWYVDNEVSLPNDSNYIHTYYQKVIEAIRRYDTNHLLLGTRRIDPIYQPTILAIEAQYFDVLSVNDYGLIPEIGYYQQWYELTGKPIIIGEYAFGSKEGSILPTFISEDNFVESIADRAIAYEIYNNYAAAQPYIVGTSYYRFSPFVTNDWGVTDFDGNIVENFVGQLGSINADMHAIHEGSLAPKVFPDDFPNYSKGYNDEPHTVNEHGVTLADDGSWVWQEGLWYWECTPGTHFETFFRSHDSDWGEQVGGYVEYRIDLDTPMTEAHLYLAYNMLSTTDSRFNVIVNGINRGSVDIEDVGDGVGVSSWHNEYGAYSNYRMVHLDLGVDLNVGVNSIRFEISNPWTKATSAIIHGFYLTKGKQYLDATNYHEVVKNTAAPVFDPQSSIMSDTNIAITSATSGAAIYYTTDGSTPTMSSSQYISPVTVSPGVTLKAMAVKDDVSWITSYTYKYGSVFYLRDGWDIVNNVAYIGGYSGTRDDTGESSDVSVPSSSSGGSYAGESELLIYYPNRSCAGIFDFDLSGIGQLQSNLADIHSAKLRLTLSSAPWFKGGTFVVREVDKAWVEDETNYWRCNTLGDLWNGWLYGMRMDLPNLDTAAIQAKNTADGQTGYVMEFDVTPLVEKWVENDEVQLGFAISYDSGSLDNVVKIAGKDYEIVNYRPMLEIEMSQSSVNTLYIRDGWDVVNNVQDSTGYVGTMDDTGKSNDYTTPTSPSGGTYAGEKELFLRDPGKSVASVINFDLSIISQLNYADVLSAELKLTLSKASWFKGGTFVVREVDKAWVEDETNYWRCNTLGSIWNDWTYGMRMDGPNLDSVTLAAENTSLGPIGTIMEFDVTSIVESWVENDNLQLGFAISYESGSLDNPVNVAGKEYDIVEYRPMLEVTYIPTRPLSDLTGDYFVDYDDVNTMAFHWLTEGTVADLNNDSFVGLEDFAILASEFLMGLE